MRRGPVKGEAQGRKSCGCRQVLGRGRVCHGEEAAWQQDATASKMQAAPVQRLLFRERRAERKNHFQGYRRDGVRWEGLVGVEVKQMEVDEGRQFYCHPGKVTKR